jgi:iron(III) transport system permease protein
VLALTLSTYPYVFLLAQAALRDLDPSLEEAARSLGLSRRRAFARVTVPALRPAVGAGALLVALYTLSDFGVVSLMRYDALTRAIYLQYRSLFDRTPAAVLALVLVALTAVVLLVEWRLRGRGRLYRSSPGAARRSAPVRLGRWRWPALAWCSLVTGVFLALPATVLGYWLVRGIRNERELEVPVAETLHSLGASGLAALAAVAAALPVAALALRYPARWTALLERLSYAGNALPGIVIALSLVFFGARYLTPLYQTLTLLVFAYVVRFFPQALSGVESSLERVNPRLEEAARGLGRGPVATALRVTVPLVRSGVLAGAALVFLSAMKELPATLLLRPIGFDTLATEVWRFTSVGAYSQAALPALLLIAVSAPFLYLVSAERRPGGGASG